MLFKEQIDKRQEQEQLHLEDAVGSFLDEVGLQSLSGKRVASDSRALKSVLAALGIKGDFDIDEENQIISAE